MKSKHRQVIVKYSQDPWHEVKAGQRIIGKDISLYTNVFRLVVFILIFAETTEGAQYYKSRSDLFWCDVINQNPEYIYKKIKTYKEKLDGRKRNNKNRVL